MKRITVAFVIFLILVITAANLGLGRVLFPFVYVVAWGDKIGHFLLMGLLSFLVNYVMPGAKVRVGSFRLPLGILLVMAGVTVEELSQLFLLFRGFSLVDLVFDYAGILVFGYGALFLVNQQRRLGSADGGE